MSEEMDITDRLMGLLKELPASLSGPITEATAEIEHLRAAVKQGEKNYRQEVAALSEANGQIKVLAAENNNLRDELHHLTIENARHEGYLDRVFEFDPVSDKRLYQDQAHPVLMRPPEEIVHTRDGFGAVSRSVVGAERRAPWYRRTGQ